MLKSRALSQRSLNPREDVTGQVQRNSATEFPCDITNTMTATALLFSKIMLSIGFEGEKGFLHVCARTGRFWPSVCNTTRQPEEILESLAVAPGFVNVGVHVGLADTTDDLQKTHALPRATANWVGYPTLLRWQRGFAQLCCTPFAESEAACPSLSTCLCSRIFSVTSLISINYFCVLFF